MNYWPHVSTEKVPTRDVAESEIPDDPVTNGSFARARGADDEGTDLPLVTVEPGLKEAGSQEAGLT